MSLTYPTFDQIDATRLTSLQELLTGVIQEYNAQIDLRRGAVQDLVLQPRSLLTAVMEQAITNALQSGSLSFITQNPTLADTTAVDRVLGNYRLIRQVGTKATGQLTIVLSSLTPVTISQGSVFTIAGVTFVSDQSYAARTTSNAVVASTDRLLTSIGNGQYAFTVGLIAQTIGSNGNVTAGTVATPTIPPTKFVKAYAQQDFIGGIDAQTNAQLVNLLLQGLATRVWSSRSSIEAVIRNATLTSGALTFPSFQGLAIMGCLDPEMLRDQHSIFPISAGGRCDLYARTQLSYQTLTISVTATLISKAGSVGTWQFGINKSAAPGYYEVVKVLLPSSDQSSSGFSILSDIRSVDLTGTAWVPDVKTVPEGTYSSYQASVCQFVDTITNASALTINTSQLTYNVVVRLMPQLGQLQALWADSTRRPPSTDILVKAPLPCFTSVTFTLTMPLGSVVDVPSIQQAIAQAVNSLGFGGQLAASYLSTVIHNLLPNLLSVSAWSLNGRIRKPDGSTVLLTSSTVITVPTDYTTMTSPRTVAFLSEVANVGVTVLYS